jgi:CrcB protein
MPVYFAVGVGGALGAVARYSLDRLLERRTFTVFPWSTFAINLSGCLLIGVVIAALVDRHAAPGWLRVGLVMGFVGGYTTFSTFAQETLDLIEEGRVALAFAYAAGSVGLGVAAVLAGLTVGRAL